MRTLDQHAALPVASPDTVLVSGRLDLTIAGTPVRIDGLDGALSARLHDLLRPFTADSEHAVPTEHIRIVPHAEAPGWSVELGGQEVMSTSDPDRLLTYLDWLAVAQALEATSDVAVFHAAALVRDGVVVLLPAKSGAGKTTLTLGLMQRGWEPLTDDIVIVDRATLQVSAFPRCFHVDDATKALLIDPSLIEWPAQLAGYARPSRWAEGAYRPHTIVVVERCVTCPSSRSPILQAEAAGALVASAIRNRLPKTEVVRIAAGLVAGARSFVRLRNGHLDGALNLIEGAARL